MLNKHYSKVTSKGQITIPTNIRNNLNEKIERKFEINLADSDKNLLIFSKSNIY